MSKNSEYYFVPAVFRGKQCCVLKHPKLKSSKIVRALDIYDI